ncbi:MAG: TonB-dependent receptor [Acidobacteriia bacterium]|nr:TonB-dependent receptor [Terriglobia bacterium]
MSGFRYRIAQVVLTGALLAPLWCQQDRATIDGTVRDASGALVPRAAVAVTGVDTGALYRAATNEAGQYALPNLPVGAYRLVFEKAGFKQCVRDGIRVTVGQVVRLDVQLEVGDRTDVVQVTDGASPLQTAIPEVGTLLENQRVVGLPLSFAGGRSPEDFAYRLVNGVSGDNWTSHVNGSPGFSKEVLLDGASITTYIAGHFGESSVSLEAIEEFRVETSGFGAEFGRTGGGIFNFVLKSGLNQPHGSLMGELRNEWMDANSFVNNFYGRPKQRDRRGNYAFSFGAPVEIPALYKGRNKTFFYAAYEKYGESNAGLGSPSVTVPLPEWWDGKMGAYLTGQAIGSDALGRSILRGAIYDPATTRTENGKVVRDPFPGNIIPPERISQVSRQLGAIMKKYYAPQVRLADGSYAMIDNSFFPVSTTTRFDQSQFSLKLDHNISERHKLSGSFAWVDRPRVLVDAGGVWDAQSPDGGPLSRARLQDVQSTMGRLAYDAVLRPDLLNHLMLALNRQINPSQSAHHNENGGAQLGIAGIGQNANFPEIYLDGGDRVTFPVLGYQTDNLLAATSYELQNTLSWAHGRHLLKFGFDARRDALNVRDISGPAQFHFSSALTGLPGFNQTGSPFASMLLGDVTSASVTVDTPTGSRFAYYGLFVQDDFKIAPRLTLNFGLRWDYQPVQTEQFDRLSNFCTTCIDPLLGIPGAMEYAGAGPGRTGRPGFEQNDRKNFGPRIGFAFQARPGLVLRAAYGIFYAPRVANDWSGSPYGQKMGFTSQDVVNNPGNNLAAFNWDQGYPGKVAAAYPDPSLAQTVYGPVHWDPQGGKVPYVQQWNANWQFSLPRQVVVDLGYLGNKATGLYANSLENLNQIPASALALGDTLGQWVDSQAAIPAAAVALGARYPFGSSGTWIPVQQTLQPFPQVPYWSTVFGYNAPLGFSTWHALQVSATRRLASGLTWMANYSFSKAISNLDSAFNTWSNYGRPLDYYNLGLEKSVASFDQTHALKFAVSYQLPIGRGKTFGSQWPKALNAIAGGWTVQVLGNYATGFPLSFTGTGIANTNFATNRAVMVDPGGASLYAGFDAAHFDLSTVSTPGERANLYVNTALVTDAPRYGLGNASFLTSQIRGFGSATEDGSLQKNFLVREGMRLQFRLEFFNLLNRHRFSSIETNAASPLFGQVTGMDASFYRQTQVGARLDF